MAKCYQHTSNKSSHLYFICSTHTWLTDPTLIWSTALDVEWCGCPPVPRGPRLPRQDSLYSRIFACMFPSACEDFLFEHQSADSSKIPKNSDSLGWWAADLVWGVDRGGSSVRCTFKRLNSPVCKHWMVFSLGPAQLLVPRSGVMA